MMSKRKEMPSDLMRELQGLPSKAEQDRPVLQPEDIPQRVQSPAPSPAKPPTSASGRKKRVTSQKRMMNRVTYEIGAELKGVIHEEAIRLGVPDSQLAKYLLLFAWDYYLNETIPEPALVESNSPKYRNGIDFS